MAFDAKKPASTRSRREPRKTPRSTAEDWIIKDEDPPGFSIEYFEEKGRGIVTSIYRMKGEFLLVYKGERIDAEEGEQREGADGSSGYRFFYSSMGRQLCVDATKETGLLGRLVNHGQKANRNAVMKEVNGHLCLFSLRDIEAGEEILYDYGLKNLPWEIKKYLEETMTQRTGELIAEPTPRHWNSLADVTLARILVFNKRRASEASKLLISQFSSRPAWGCENKELLAALKPIERHLMKHVFRMTMVEVLGKQGKRVPVLLSKTMSEAVQALIHHRPGVKSSNPHVFAQTLRWMRKLWQKIRTSLLSPSHSPSSTLKTMREGQNQTKDRSGLKRKREQSERC